MFRPKCLLQVYSTKNGELPHFLAETLSCNPASAFSTVQSIKLDRQVDRQTDRQTDMQAHRWIERKTEGWIVRQTQVDKLKMDRGMQTNRQAHG